MDKKSININKNGVLKNTDMGGLNIPNSSIKYTFALTTEKYIQAAALGNKPEIDICLAKNEWESFQLLLACENEDESVYVEATDFKNNNGDVLKTEVYYAHYSYIEYEANGNGNCYYPDALVPLKIGSKVIIKKGNNQAFFFEIRSNENTAAGDYFATVTVKNNDGIAVLERKIRATVWDFTLPQEHYSQTAAGIFCGTFFELAGNLPNNGEWGWNARGYDKLSDEQEAVYKQYYDYLMEHGLSAYMLPYDILDPRADEYMSNPKVTSFGIPYYSDDEMLASAYKKIASNPEWKRKAYFYPIDEPRKIEDYEEYNALIERLNRLCSGYNMVTPFYTLAIPEKATVNPFELQKKNNTILCPESICYESDYLRREMKELTESGKRAWWYVCCGPDDSTGMCNMFTHQAAIKHRMLFWQEYYYDVTGFLYWDTVSWDFCVNPWVDARSLGEWHNAGDGLMLYPGNKVGIDGPVGSLRLKNLTAGLEDYDYLKMAEQEFGKEWVRGTVAKLTTSLTEYTGDCELMEAVRREIGQKLSKM